MFTLINRTRCQVHPQLMLDAHAEEHLLLVIKASFLVTADRLLPTDAEIELADRYRGDPAASSLAAAGEVALHKQHPDLLLSGNAYPTQPGGATGYVSFRVGAWSKECIVFGDRTWTRGVTGLRPSAPEPFDAIPLVYERAFGGAELASTPPRGCAENPVGVGMFGCQAGTPLPNLEHPKHRLEAARRPRLSGRSRRTGSRGSAITAPWTPPGSAPACRCLRSTRIHARRRSVRPTRSIRRPCKAAR